MSDEHFLITKEHLEEAFRCWNADCETNVNGQFAAHDPVNPAEGAEILLGYLRGLSMPDETIHPAPQEFTSDQLSADPILRFFHYAHLPVALQAASKPFCDVAHTIIDTLPRNAERSVSLRKLLEAKDAAVRANVPA
jgi:hypothetical protein